MAILQMYLRSNNQNMFALNGHPFLDVFDNVFLVLIAVAAPKLSILELLDPLFNVLPPPLDFVICVTRIDRVVKKGQFDCDSFLVSEVFQHGFRDLSRLKKAKRPGI